MADSSKNRSGGSCLGKLTVLVLLVATIGLGAALFFIAKPQDLSDIGGYGPAIEHGSSRDMKVVLKNSIDRGYAVTLTEAEINQWLARTLVTKQGGMLGDQVSLKRVWVRLLDGHAEIIMERKFMEKLFTVSMFLRIEQLQGLKGIDTRVHLDGGFYHENIQRPARGGRFGSLVVPQGFLILVMPAYQKFAELFEAEKSLIEDMSRIRIEKGRLVLDPREPTDGFPGLPETF